MLHLLPENPFFVREVRAFGRRGLGLLAWPLMVQALFLCVPLLVMERAAAGQLQPVDAWRGLSLVFLGLGHAAVSGGVGWIAGKRVLGEEHRRRALDGLRLLTRNPAGWLAQKLVFPLYVVGLVWSAALPYYAATALRGHFLPGQLAPGALLALCLGLLTFGAALLAPAEGLRSPIRSGKRVRPAAAWSDVLRMGLPAWIALVLLRLAFDWMLYALNMRPSPFRSAPFFGASFATDQGLAVLFSAYAVTCFGAAHAVVNPAGQWSTKLRDGARILGVAVAYGLFLGYQWPGVMTLGFALMALGGCAAAVLAALPAEWRERLTPARGKRPRGEDRLSARELAGLARRWDNAVFVRDLRVALRGGGLLRQFALNSGGLCLLTVAMTGAGAPFLGAPVAPGGGGSSLAQRLALSAIAVSSWLMLPALLAYGGRSLASWGTERRCSTLLQVFASPLATETVVRGRWIAAVLVGLARSLPAPLIFLAGLLVVGSPGEILFHLGLGFWLATLGLILSAGLAGSAQDTAVALEDLFCAGCVAVYVVMAEGALFLWLWTQAPLVNGTPDRTALLAFAWTLTPLNLAATYLVYRRAVADIGYLRRKETE